jgi:hypothetical protein
MKKQMLNPENLRVDSFETGATHAGTKALYTQGEYTCATCGASPPLADVATRPTTVHCCV